MRHVTRNKTNLPGSSKKEPLAEGLQVIPNGPSGRRLWNRMTYDEIIDFAKKLVKEKEISGRSELSKEDPGLYRILRIRKLLGEIDFEKKRRKYRSWSSISDEEIVGLAKKTMTENDVCARYEFRNVDQGLYDILKTRGLLGKVGFKKKLRPWKDMSDEEIVELARRVMKEQRITGKGELQKKDVGLYYILRRRKLVEKVGFETKIRKRRSWKDMDNEEIVRFARKVIEEKEISGRSELCKADSGLYLILRKKGLLDEVGFKEMKIEQRSWKETSDEEIVAYAIRFISSKNINGRKDLQKMDKGIYSVLWKRGLLDRAFARVDQKKEEQARDAVIAALDAFAANDNNCAE
ncbi:hypothetical protein KKE38_05360, partial [Candidatus Micrarchaeota archaeon]|nr:hypothetical protein [Candidatus Micrarchaeota archaeon]